MKSVVLLAAVALSIGLSVACNVFRPLDECRTDVDCARGTTCAAERYCESGAPIRVGVLLPITGNQSQLTPERERGMRFGQWIVERDPAHRILGRGLAFSIADTLSSITEAPIAAQRLLDRNVAALLGPVASAEVLEVQKLTFPRQLLHIAPSAGAGALGDAQPGGVGARFSFQLSTEIANGSVRAIPNFLASPSRPAEFASCRDGMVLVVTDDATGESYRAGMENLMPRNCVPITGVVVVPRDRKADYESEISAMIDAKNGAKPTRCAFIAVRPDIAGDMLRSLKAREGRSARAPYNAFIGASLLQTDEFFDTAKSAVAGEPSLAEGFYGINGDSSPPRVEFLDLQSLWMEYLAAHPDLSSDLPLGTTGPGYAEGVILLALAAELAGRVDDGKLLRDAFVELLQPGEGDLVVGPRDIAAAFSRIRAARAGGRRAAIDYRGAISNFDLDERGFVNLPALVWRAKNGKIETVLRFDEEAQTRAFDDPGPACP